jgi:hypothetical protein
MTPESRVRLAVHARFGGGPSEKGQTNWHLAGGLPYDQHGLGRDRRKRTRTTGISPAAHFTRRAGARNGVRRAMATAVGNPDGKP